MNFLFLRGQVPQDRNPQEIVFDKIEECDDIWTHLIYAMTRSEDQTELWYWGGKRKQRFSKNFIERWIPDFSTYKTNFVPDVIFCRGGFKEYNSVINRFPNAFKIYYGAGRRFVPEVGFGSYDLILQDSKSQLKTSKSIFPSSKSILYVKPAIDHMFKPMKVKKEFDIVFPANGTQEAIKGHSFVFSTAPVDLKILNLGNKPRKNTVPPRIKRKRVLKKNMPRELQRAKVGIVCCGGEIDSCPRVIPEMIACGIPIVVLDETRFWKEKYINSKTGVIASKKDFWNKVRATIANSDQFDPRSYYEEELSLEKAADYIRSHIK